MSARTEVAKGGQGVFSPVELTLRDGRPVTVREVREEDREGVASAFEKLSAESRYTRFMAPVRELSPAMLDRVVHPPGDRDLALVALHHDGAGDTLVGGARYVANPDGRSCEFAVTLADDWHGVGLARQLMELLIGSARRRGFRTMEGFILTSNSGMRGLARRLGFDDEPMPDDPTVRLVRLPLD